MSLNNQSSHDRDDICSPSTDVEPAVESFSSVTTELDIILENKSLDPENLTCRQNLYVPYTDDVDGKNSKNIIFHQHFFVIDLEISTFKQTTTTTIITDYVEPKKKKSDIGHIMISYNHSTKALCTRIAQALRVKE